MVNRFRVLMANQPKLMRQLLLEILKEDPSIEIVGENDARIPDSRTRPENHARPGSGHSRQSSQATGHLR